MQVFCVKKCIFVDISFLFGIKNRYNVSVGQQDKKRFFVAFLGEL